MNIATLKDDKLEKMIVCVLFCYCVIVGIILGIA